MSNMNKKELVKLVSYFVMGDGGLYRKESGNARFILVQRKDHLDFCEWAKSVVSNVTTTKISFVDRSKDTDMKRQNQYRVESHSHPFLTSIHERVYTDGYKGIDPHALKLLDWEAASILFQSDGSTQHYLRPEIGMVNPSWKITLNMKRLSYGDQVLLKRALEEKGMGVWNVNRQNQYYYLSLSTKHASLFLDGISPYVVPSYQYKLG